MVSNDFSLIRSVALISEEGMIDRKHTKNGKIGRFKTFLAAHNRYTRS